MCQSPQPGAEPDGRSGEESDTTSCRAKEEERASFGEERRGEGSGAGGEGEEMNLLRRKEKRQEQSC